MAKEKKMVFTSKIVEEMTNKINDGILVKRFENPWLKGEVGVRRSGVAFKMTNDEQQEYVKCALDIHYFVEKYCKVKREDGTTGHITLRDYQSDILDDFVENRFNILMASRQIGKCNDLTTSVLACVNSSNTLIKIPLFKLYFKYKKNKTIYDKIKYFLYIIVYKFH